MRAQDATAIGTIGIIMGWWNAFNGPFVARWADSGALNRRVPCFASWGRRAPWLLLGAPLLMAGTVLMWLPPAFDDLTLLVMQWGQFLDHDITFTPLVKGRKVRKYF